MLSRTRREQLVLDVWRSFDKTRQALTDVWTDDIPPPRAVVESIVEDARVDVGRQLRRVLLQRPRRWFRPRMRPHPPTRLATDATPVRRYP